MRLLPVAVAALLPFKKPLFSGKLLLKILLWGLLLMSAALTGFAQEEKPINQRDKAGKPHGFWYLQHPERMSDPAYTEFGTYEHGRKSGIWYVLNSEGALMAAQRYKANALDGESRYYENGKLSVVGNYRGLNPDQAYDTIWVKHPVTGEEKKVVVSTDRGATRHGTWRYYSAETGAPTLEEEYQVDDLILTRNLGVAKEDSAVYRQRVGKLPHNNGLPPQKTNRTRLTEW